MLMSGRRAIPRPFLTKAVTPSMVLLLKRGLNFNLMGFLLLFSGKWCSTVAGSRMWAIYGTDCTQCANPGSSTGGALARNGGATHRMSRSSPTRRARKVLSGNVPTVNGNVYPTCNQIQTLVLCNYHRFQIGESGGKRLSLLGQQPAQSGHGVL